MPRVSSEHLEARRRQILDAARTCFVRNGFHMTSMQDVLREADLSMGAVYRYFASKEELIHAIADDALADVRQALAPLVDVDAPPPLEEALGLLVRQQPPLDGGRESARLLIQVWSEAVRSPELATRYRAAMHAFLRFLEGVVRAYQERGWLTRTVAPEAVARALAALVHGFMIQRAFLDDLEFSGVQDALRALMTSARPGEVSEHG